MSQKTGAQLIALPVQTTELMNWLRQANPVQIIYIQVPELYAKLGVDKQIYPRSGV